MKDRADGRISGIDNCTIVAEGIPCGHHPSEWHILQRDLPGELPPVIGGHAHLDFLPLHQLPEQMSSPVSGVALVHGGAEHHEVQDAKPFVGAGADNGRNTVHGHPLGPVEESWRGHREREDGIGAAHDTPGASGDDVHLPYGGLIAPGQEVGDLLGRHHHGLALLDLLAYVRGGPFHHDAIVTPT